MAQQSGIEFGYPLLQLVKCAVRKRVTRIASPTASPES
jgi:hypothetical protein